MWIRFISANLRESHESKKISENSRGFADKKVQVYFSKLPKEWRKAYIVINCADSAQFKDLKHRVLVA